MKGTAGSQGRADSQHVTDDPVSGGTPHIWVGAALVGLGNGGGDGSRVEHAARTGRHVLPARTRVEVLEVYCASCRLAYSERARRKPCEGQALQSVVHVRPAC